MINAMEKREKQKKIRELRSTGMGITIQGEKSR